MNKKSLILLIGIIAFSNFSNALNTPLENFVALPDEGYSFVLNSEFSTPQYDAYVLNYTSMNWLTADVTNHPRWWHWLTICVPRSLQLNSSFLYIEDGTYTTEAPTSLPQLIDTLCKSSGSVVSLLNQNPNQPLMIDGVERSEDGILAYTWKKFLTNHTLVNWVGQFAQTKSAVRAMNVVQEFMLSKRSFKVEKFVVSGGSKRGWASWLTAAVDSRVQAVIPIVMPILSINQNSINHFRSYGGWSYAYYDYFVNGVVGYFNSPAFDNLAKLIDPINFVDQLRMPKYVITSVGDQYFIPDSPTNFWPKLLSTKHLRIHPNADHSLAARFNELVQEVNVYYNLVINNHQLPTYEWSIVPDMADNSTTLLLRIIENNDCSKPIKPHSVVVYTADTISKTKRDWRYITCPDPSCKQNITWVPTVIQGNGNVYRYKIEQPKTGGWRGAFMEVTYDSYYGNQKYTSDFAYAPYLFPFENCGSECQNKPFPA
eukprot:gene11139-13645_t